MAAKKRHHVGGQNVKTNLIKRKNRAERLGKSANYIRDLEKAIEKHH